MTWALSNWTKYRNHCTILLLKLFTLLFLKDEKHSKLKLACMETTR